MSVISYESPLEYKEGFLCKILAKRLPRLWKRYIFISSLSSMLQRTSHLDRVLVSKVARMLEIEERPLSNRFPVILRNKIWSNRLCHRIFIQDRSIRLCEILNLDISNNSEYITLGNMVYRQTPKWMHYASQEYMVRDASLLIQQLSRYNNQIAINKGCISMPCRHR